jgi:hypothetical protein
MFSYGTNVVETIDNTTNGDTTTTSIDYKYPNNNISAGNIIYRKQTNSSLTQQSHDENPTSNDGSYFYQEKEQYDSSNDDISLMVYLSGEFGNHLLKLIRGYGIAHVAKVEYNITSRVILRQQFIHSRNEKPTFKSQSTQQHLQRCFQRFEQEDFELGNRILLHYNDLFDQPDNITLDGPLDDLRENLSRLKTYLNTTTAATTSAKDHHGRTVPSHYHNESSQQIIDLPSLPSILVKTDSFRTHEFFDLYYDEVRDHFAFNDSVCCNQLPEPDESVFVSVFPFSSLLVIWFILFAHSPFIRSHGVMNSTTVASRGKCQGCPNPEGFKN